MDASTATTPRIRPGLPGDLDAIVALETAADTAEWLGTTGADWHRAALSDPCRRHLVAVDATGRALGFSVLAWADHQGPAEIRRLVVGGDERGRGLGRALLLASIRAVRESHENRVVWLDVKRTNQRGIRLYASVGFITRTDVPPYADADAVRAHDLMIMTLAPRPL